MFSISMNRSKLNIRKTTNSDYENLANRVKFKNVNRRENRLQKYSFIQMMVEILGKKILI